MRFWHQHDSLRASVAFALWSFTAAHAHAATLNLSDVPLFTTQSAPANLIMAIDDSGSMDFEVLLPTNIGTLWWDDYAQSFYQKTNQNKYLDGTLGQRGKFSLGYLFPGEDTKFGDTLVYSIPPTKQFAFLRSHEFNPLYFNPKETYSPWPASVRDDGTPRNFPAQSISAAKLDPRCDSGCTTLNLTVERKENASKSRFFIPNKFILPKGTSYAKNGVWVTAAEDLSYADIGRRNLGIGYIPSVFYTKVSDGNATFTLGSGAGARAIACGDSTPADYDTFYNAPSDFSSTDGVHSLAPDGSCLAEHRLRTGTPEEPLSAADEALNTNFANWFTYYRKRHLATRKGLAEAVVSATQMNMGFFTINRRNVFKFWDADAKASLIEAIYNTPVDGGTPNREAMADFGRVYLDTSISPIKYECQKNFALLVTDGYSDLPPWRFSYSTIIGNQDKNEPAPYGVSSGSERHTNSAGDIALWLYKGTSNRIYNNLGSSRSASQSEGPVSVPAGCNLETPDPKLDCNPHPHINSYILTLGTLGKFFGTDYLSVADAYEKEDANGTKLFPDWNSLDINTAQVPDHVDDLYHAAVNGRGEMFNANSATELSDKLAAVISSIESRVGTASSVTFNTSTLETDTALYRATFNSSNWSGDVTKLTQGSTGEFNIVSWSAAARLDEDANAWKQRNILTLTQATDDGAEANAILEGAQFEFDALSSTQRAALTPIGSDGNSEVIKAVINYLRGDRSGEDTVGFRPRASILGDVVNSNPIYVGPPALGWPDTAPFPTSEESRYSTFQAQNQDRAAMVYFGANDGMLHGIAADTGYEAIAYIPSYHFDSEGSSRLLSLTDPDYDHQYYVDLPPTISDVFLDGAWRTVLLGGSRGGGEGLFLLDVTDPSTFSTTSPTQIALGEFTHEKLGKTFSKPTIAMIDDGTSTARWVAIFGNGYNSPIDPALFIVDLAGFNGSTWVENENFWIIEASISGAGSSANGLSTPAVIDSDGDGTADLAYAGDLLGNLWRFDFDDLSGATQAPTKVFTAEADNEPQPITSRPAVARAFFGDAGDFMIFFGTGKYLELQDLDNTNQQTFYAVLDDNSGAKDRGDLLEQKFETSQGSRTNASEVSLRLATETGIDEDGWFIDLGKSGTEFGGERVVVDPTLRGDLVFFNTWIPSQDKCDSGGDGFLMSVSQANGGAPSDPLPGIFDRNDDDYEELLKLGGPIPNPIGERFNNGLPASSTFLDDTQYTPGTGSDQISRREVTPLQDSGRISWQQLIAE